MAGPGKIRIAAVLLLLFSALASPSFADELGQLRERAAAGEAQAQMDLGAMLYYGDGVAESRGEAASWYGKAAAQGETEARLFMGMACYRGEGVAQDYREAAQWFLLAAESGDRTAQSAMALLYRYGDGVERDLVQAYKWYGLAAEQEDGNAEQALAELVAEMTAAQIAEAKKLIRTWTPKE
ncbi:tetratricopeptide repeat protein [Thiovibrio sp. JS02]